MSTARDSDVAAHGEAGNLGPGLLRPRKGSNSSSSSDGEDVRRREATPTLRQKGSHLSVRSAARSEAHASPVMSASILLDDLDEADASALVEDLEESMRQSKTIDQFTRIITEFRHERKRRSRGSFDGLRSRASREGVLTESSTPNGYHTKLPLQAADANATSARSPAASWSRKSIDSQSEMGDSDTSASNLRPGVIVRCTCCCNLDTCDRASRATTEWADMEQDLRLAAEIGQALLRKHDALVASTSAAEARHTGQRDALMKKLTRSIKESNDKEKRLSQTMLNLEAADSSNRALLAELDACRRHLSQAKAEKARFAAAESRSTRLSRELEDAKQELQEERKRSAASEAKAKRASDKAAQLASDLRQSIDDVKRYRAQEEAVREHSTANQAASSRLAPGASDRNTLSTSPRLDEPTHLASSLAMENEALQQQVDQTASLLRAANEEVASLRDELVNRSSRPSDLMRTRSLRVRPQHGRTVSSFNETYRMPLMNAAADNANKAEENGTDAAPALAEELLLSSERSHSRTGSLPGGPRPLLLAKEGRSQSRASSRQESSSPRLSSARLLSPTLPYIDSSGSTEKASAVVQSTAASDDQLSDRRPQASEAEKIRAAYAATSASSEAESQSDHGTSSSAIATGSGSTLTIEASTSHTHPSTSTAPSSAVTKPRDPRTTQLMTLLDYVQRLYTRLASADVDTLTRRLQRQHLAGDVGHLARVTLSGITRDAEGLREHFRRAIEAEARGAGQMPPKDPASGDAASLHSSRSGGERPPDHESSLLARKDFFALVKLMRDLLFEMAKLRAAINEVQLSPANASRILQEHLGVAAQEDKGMGAWFGKLISTGLAGVGVGGSGSVEVKAAGEHSTPTGLSADSAGVSAGAAAKSGIAPARPTMGAPASAGGFLAALSRPPSRAGGQQRSTSRGAAAVGAPSTVAVEVKGSRTSATDARISSNAGSTFDSSAPLAEPGLMTDTMSNASTSVTASAGLGGLRAGPRPTRGRANLGPTAAHRLSRVQSRNLSGLFAGAPADAWQSLNPPSAMSGSSHLYLGSNRPLSRVVDDDEVSLHHGKPGWGNDEDGIAASTQGHALRKGHARGLSDSSIHSTFLEHAVDTESGMGRSHGRQAPELAGLGLMTTTPSFPQRGGPAGPSAAANANRIMNRSTLALQPSTAHEPGVASGTQSPAQSVDSSSTVSAHDKANHASRDIGRVGGAGFLSSLVSGFPSLRPQTSSAALSLAAATALPTTPTAEVATGGLSVPAALTPDTMAIPIGSASGRRGLSTTSDGKGSSTPYSTSPAARDLLSASMRRGEASSPGNAGALAVAGKPRNPSTSSSTSSSSPSRAKHGPSPAPAQTAAPSLRPPVARGSSRSGF
ncbi:unnamed protein product [Parajaminaea phylloscopi]